MLPLFTCEQCTNGTIDNASVDNELSDVLRFPVGLTGTDIDAAAAVVADADAVDAGLLGCNGNAKGNVETEGTIRENWFWRIFSVCPPCNVASVCLMPAILASRSPVPNFKSQPLVSTRPTPAPSNSRTMPFTPINSNLLTSLIADMSSTPS